MGFDTELFWRRLRGSRDFWASAVETHEVHPTSVVEFPAAIHEDDFNDISGLAPGAPLVDRIGYMQGGQRKLGATTAHRFTNLRIAQGSIYSDSGHIQLRKQQPKAFGGVAPIVLDTPVALSCNRASTSVYYHFAIEQTNRELLAGDMGLAAVTLPSLKPFWHEAQLRAAMELDAQIIDSAVIKDGWVFVDRPRNASFAERFERLRAKTCKAKGKGNRLIYLKRGSKGAEKRDIQNEEAFEVALAKLGFETLEASNPDLDVLAETLSQARVTCTIEGSQAAHHFLYAPKGAALLTLMPADRFNHILKEMCDILDMPFGFVLGQVSGTQEYDYPIEKVEKVLSRIEARMA